MGCKRKKPANGLLPTTSRTSRDREQSAMSATSFNTSDEERLAKHEQREQQLRHVPIPTATSCATFGYQRALINRIHSTAFMPRAPYDAATHKPTFIHDTLMLPGILANLIGMTSTEDLVPGMTPALLPGVHAHLDLESMRPILVITQRPEDHVQGMLVYGLGKEARDILRTYYHSFAHRRRVEVEFEVCAETSSSEQVSPERRWRLERRFVHAYAWVKSGLDDCELSMGNDSCPTWRLEDFLEGKLSLQDPIRIEKSGAGDEDDDGYIGREIVEYASEPEEEEREVVYSGAGLLDYVRAPHATGW